MRVFDTFAFDGELDVLEHRLEQTYDLIDAFVLVEAAQTYSGRAKDLTFSMHRERFAWAAEKLRPVALGPLGGPHRSPRQRAAVQRDAIRLGLRDAGPEDAVLILDVDEVPSRNFLQRLRAEGIDVPRRVLMTRMHEHADAVAPRSPCCTSDVVPFQTATPYRHPGCWQGLTREWQSASGVVVPYAALRSRDAFSLRFGEIDAAPVADGGRHFSSVDPSTHAERKRHRVFHTEWAGDREMAPHHLARCRDHGVHARGWWYAERPDGPPPPDVQLLLDRLGAPGKPFPALRRRRLVRTWAWMRLHGCFPDALVAFVDGYFERLTPVLCAPLLAADLLRQAAGSAMSTRLSDISRTNAATSLSHVARSTA